MFNYKMPYVNPMVLGDVQNSMKLSSTNTSVECGAFLTMAMEDGKGVVKVGSTASTDQFLGIALTGSFGTRKVVVVKGIVPTTKTITLPSIPVVGTYLVLVKGMSTVVTISGTTLTFDSPSVSEGDPYKIIYKTEMTAIELESLQGNLVYPDDKAGMKNGCVDVALTGEFITTNFDSSCDFESATSLKIDTNGCLTTKGSGVDVSNRVFILEVPSEGTNGCLKFRLR